MKIAVFDQTLSKGGGLRFLISLLVSVKHQRPDFDITLFCDTTNLKKLKVYDVLVKNGINVVEFGISYSKKIDGLLNLLSIFIYIFTKKKVISIENIHRRHLQNRITKASKNVDLAFFPWPYFMEFPETHCPKVAVFHDFNYKYFFGMPIFNHEQTTNLDRSIEWWINHSAPVVSTNFMYNELKKFYPDSATVNVVHLPSLNPAMLDMSSTQAVQSSLIPSGRYFLCSAHIVFHKNIGNVITALSILNAERDEKIKLIITGSGTEIIKGKSAYLGMERNTDQQCDVIGMGYVEDNIMEQLIIHSIGVINASFYEAGNGVGLDAWQLGVPVLQSTIPAFREHIDLQGYRAFEFDPKNPDSIANAMTTCIENNTMREDFILQSLNASKLNNWNVAANKYIEIFERTIEQA